MNGRENAKYMDAMSLIGNVTGVLLIMLYVITRNYWFVVAGLAVIFGFRFIGWSMDQVEAKNKGKKRRR